MTSVPAPWRILVVCTANVCRSPVVERLLQERLRQIGREAVVTSAGTHGGRLDPHRHTVKAAKTVGVDLKGHRSRLLTPEIVRADGADLVLPMTREHLREIIGVEPGAWPRTFTLRELTRRGVLVPAGTADLASFTEAAGSGRMARDLMHRAPEDDVSDPYGGPYRGHLAMVREVDELITQLVRLLPTGNA